MAAVVKDDNGVPIPQVQNSSTGTFEAWQGVSGAGRVREENGANVALGSTTDVKATNGTSTATAIALLKAILDKPSGGGGTDITTLQGYVNTINGNMTSLVAMVSNGILAGALTDIYKVMYPKLGAARKEVVTTSDTLEVDFTSDKVYGVRIIINPISIDGTVKVAIVQTLDNPGGFDHTIIESIPLVAMQRTELILYPGASDIANVSRNLTLPFQSKIKILETGGSDNLLELYIEELLS